jgi:hypothetical protein
VTLQNERAEFCQIAADEAMTKKSDDRQVFAGQLVAQGMLIQILMGQIVLSAPDRGAAVREALVQGTEAIRSNPNMTETETFGAVKTLEDALDTLDRINADTHGT